MWLGGNGGILASVVVFLLPVGMDQHPGTAKPFDASLKCQPFDVLGQRFFRAKPRAHGGEPVECGDFCFRTQLMENFAPDGLPRLVRCITTGHELAQLGGRNKKVALWMCKENGKDIFFRQAEYRRLVASDLGHDDQRRIGLDRRETTAANLDDSQPRKCGPKNIGRCNAAPMGQFHGAGDFHRRQGRWVFHVEPQAFVGRRFEQCTVQHGGLIRVFIRQDQNPATVRRLFDRLSRRIEPWIRCHHRLTPSGTNRCPHDRRTQASDAGRTWVPLHALRPGVRPRP